MNDPLRSSQLPRLSAHVRLVSDPIRGQQMLLGPEKVLVLNGTGAAILGLCDGQRTVAEIAEHLRGRFRGVDVAEIEGFLARLANKGCIEVADE